MSRIVFILLTGFWITMNVLLWRAEFGNREAGGTMSAEVVWEKILTAPDSSSLAILQRGKRIGYCHWATGVGDEWGNVSDENLPNGLPARERGYRLRVEGTAVESSTNQLRFEGALRLDRHRAWQEATVRLHLRPLNVEIHSVAAEQSVRLKADAPDFNFERVLRFAELANPSALLSEFGAPMAGEWLEGMKLPSQNRWEIGAVLKWEAREDSLRIGHSTMRVYRLQTRWLDRYQARVFVSRVGEILRVELPNDLVLVNDALFIL